MATGMFGALWAQHRVHTTCALTSTYLCGLLLRSVSVYACMMHFVGTKFFLPFLDLNNFCLITCKNES
jgi:hypothetical protein